MQLTIYRVDEFLLPMIKNHEFLRQHNWKDHIGIRHNPFTYSHDCEGITMFEKVSESPERLARFNEAMVAQDSSQVTIGIYPFAEELGKYATDDTVTIVDVGVGRGHILRQIKESSPGLKGRFILQDRDEVIEDNKKSLISHGIEAMAHDFFKPQPVKGLSMFS